MRLRTGIVCGSQCPILSTVPVEPCKTLELHGADVRYIEAYLAAAEADELFSLLRSRLEWRQDRIRIFGQEHELPRLQAWYGDAGARYAYSGMALEPCPWIEPLSELRARLERDVPLLSDDFAGARFNSVLANLYRDGRDSNGWHADDEPELGPRPLIASISLGETRRFRMRSISPGHAPISLDLVHGSLLLMAGDTQRTCRHQVPKTARSVGARINLTWRWIVGRADAGPARAGR